MNEGFWSTEKAAGAALLMTRGTIPAVLFVIPPVIGIVLPIAR
jgi:hypothetical protein